jgi:gliding motility-associated protein GldL
MNIGDFLHSKRWKLMQNYIYSWGASVVLIGALFKLEHLPYASVLLGVGLSIEAIIFFVSAFEPMMELPDWKVIYPQLRTGKESKRDLEKIEIADKKYFNPYLAGHSGVGAPVAKVSTAEAAVPGLPEEQMKSLKESLERLAQTANGLKNISDATTATESFVKNLSEASESIGSVVNANKNVASVMDESVKGISNSYQKAAESVDKTVEGLSGIYSSAAEQMKNSSQKANSNIEESISKLSSSVEKTAQELSQSSAKTAKTFEETGNGFAKKIDKSAEEMSVSYREMTNSLSKGFKGFEKSSGNYTANLDKLNKNMSAINAAYELHLKGTVKVEEIVKNYQQGVGEIGKLLSVSVEETKKFNQNTKEINENIQALNSIYGKMLGALNNKR